MALDRDQVLIRNRMFSRLADLESDIREEELLGDSYAEQADVHYQTKLRRERERDELRKVLGEA